MKKILLHMLDELIFLLTGKGSVASEAVDAGVLDYSGQGRDRHGR